MAILKVHDIIKLTFLTALKSILGLVGGGGSSFLNLLGLLHAAGTGVRGVVL